MKYLTVLKKLEKKHVCPFCHEKEENILQVGKYFYVIPARVPYTKDHILIIPKRHVNLLITLSHKELKEMHEMVDIRTKKLHTKHKDISLLLRDGLVSDLNISKSVNHLHFHLLPDIGVHLEGIKHQKPEDRVWIEDNEYTKLAQKIRKKFL
ncbi:MAG TPA: HIT domain-containing protein [Candidatus Absconditabacterales bacterium]|nr:HIT domain-containing protein [Candidatus Absconditabacterales bacterium]